MIGRNITGERFGLLVAIEELDKRSKDGKVLYLCQCDCGASRIVKATELRTGKVKSCGCTHGNKKYRGFSLDNKLDISIYRRWNDMIRRCEDPRRDDYKNYGERGISVCDSWHDFSAFLDWCRSSGFSSDMTLDRIDVNGNYSPENCRWANCVTQANNKRSNHTLTLNGDTKTMSEWARITGFNYSTIRERKRKGWSDERTLTEPTRKRGVV